MVLSGSGTGSDLSLSAADSGINLSSPTDSGLSLEADSGIQLQSPTDSGLSLEEEPLDLGGSSISSLELPEDEEVVELDDSDVGEPVQKDEEFLLSPSDEMFIDESDSGSQVIALEDSEAFDQDAATMVPAEGGQALLALLRDPGHWRLGKYRVAAEQELLSFVVTTQSSQRCAFDIYRCRYTPVIGGQAFFQNLAS